RVERVKPRTKLVGDAPFIHEQRHLRIPDRELAAVLDFAVLHGITIGKNAIAWFRPVNDINELFAEKRSQTHEFLPTSGDCLLTTLVKYAGCASTVHSNRSEHLIESYGEPMHKVKQKQSSRNYRKVIFVRQ